MYEHLTDSQDCLPSAGSQLRKIIFHINTALQVHHAFYLIRQNLLLCGPLQHPLEEGSGTNIDPPKVTGVPGRLNPGENNLLLFQFRAFSTGSAYEAVMGWHKVAHLKLEAGGSRSCSRPWQADAEVRQRARLSLLHPMTPGREDLRADLKPHMRGTQVTRLLLCSEGARLGSGLPDAEWGWAAEPSLLTS